MSATAERRAYYERIRPLNLTPLWESLHALVPREPQTPCVPALWHYKDIRPYLMQAGERNRGLSIIKSRGTAHSNQVRELILSDAGVTLADTYTAGGEVLMGTLRIEKENAMRAEAERKRHEIERKRR